MENTKTVYEDYKYCIQDISTLYVGSHYTFGELLDRDDVMFKFQLVVERYLLPESDREDTLETHLYYLDPKSFLVKIYRQLRARVKVCVLEDKRTLTGKTERRYVTKVMRLEELVKIPPAEKERQGMVIQELSMSKLALMAI